MEKSTAIILGKESLDLARIINQKLEGKSLPHCSIMFGNDLVPFNEISLETLLKRAAHQLEEMGEELLMPYLTADV